jgi:hypothetical protein
LVAAALMTAAGILLVALTGTVGVIICVAFLVVCLIVGANQRLKNMGAEDFWNSRPKD